MQFHASAAVRRGRDGGGGAGMIVTNFGSDFEGLRRGLERNPITAIDVELVSLQIGIAANNDTIVCDIQLDDVEGFAGGNSKAFALADGVEFDPVMVDEHASG